MRTLITPAGCSGSENSGVSFDNAAGRSAGRARCQAVLTASGPIKPALGQHIDSRAQELLVVPDLVPSCDLCPQPLDFGAKGSNHFELILVLLIGHRGMLTLNTFV